MTKLHHRALIAIAVLAAAALYAAAEPGVPRAPVEVRFGELAALPDAHGFAGMYVGVSGDALIAAGGTNFPNKPFSDGGDKRWYDHIFVMTEVDGGWRKAEQRLPRPLAHGVAVTHGGGVICVGGAGPDSHHADVFEIRRGGDGVDITPLPPLPAAAAYMAGAIAGDVLYIAGGQPAPDAAEGTADFWALDLSVPREAMAWQRLTPWPGPPRHRAVAAAIDSTFLLFSGVRSEADEAGKQRWTRPLLTDAYRYTPARGAAGVWTRLPSLPRAAVAAASPALVVGDRVLIPSGVSDAFLDADREHFAGFPRDVLVFDPVLDAWASGATMPPGASCVVPGVTHWRDRYVLVSGETAPGLRTPRVFTLTAR